MTARPRTPATFGAPDAYRGVSFWLDDLVEHCRTVVAGYKVPRALVVTDDVHRQPSGKPDYRWAKELARTSLA